MYGLLVSCHVYVRTTSNYGPGWRIRSSIGRICEKVTFANPAVRHRSRTYALNHLEFGIDASRNGATVDASLGDMKML